jgi:endo-1,4-beta-D-glucanase Y
MKTKFLPLLAVAFFLVGCNSDPINGGDEPGGTGNAIKPNNRTQDQMDSDVTGKYNTYKNNYLVNTGNYSYIKATGTNESENAITISEAHGYGMIIFALMDDRTNFDRMNAFRKAHPSNGNSNLMSWFVNVVGQVPNTGSTATDGDLDIAYALCLASKKWGTTYQNEARTYINAIKATNMSQSTKRTRLGSWSNDINTRSSDWRPAHFRAFYNVTKDDFWLQAADTVYKLIGQVSNSTTGLIPDFITGQNPARPDPNAGGTGESNAQHYSYNACRNPLWLAMDYAHNGNRAAKTQIDKISAWLRGKSGGNASGIKAGYMLNGTVLDGRDYNDIVFTAPFAAGMIANSDNQNFLNNAYNAVRNQNLPAQNQYDGNKPNSYAAALQLLSMLLITGNWEAPN